MAKSDYKAMMDVQRIKTFGGTARLSISQITCLIVNLPDAQDNLPPEQFQKVLQLFYRLRADKKRVRMDMDGYLATAMGIVKQFNSIAPYEKYSGEENEETPMELLAYMESAEGIAFYEKNKRIVDAARAKKRKVKTAAIAVLVFLAVALCFYVYNVSSYFKMDDSVYKASADGMIIYYHFRDDRTIDLIAHNDYYDFIVYAQYGYSGYFWNRLIGNLYFSRDSLLSLTTVEDGAKPATLSMVCKDNFYIEGDIENDSGDFKKIDEELIGNVVTSDLLVFDNQISVDGLLMTEVDEVEPIIQELVNIFSEVEPFANQ